MVKLEPAIYTGTLRHRRFAPKAHEFTYSIFMALLDIDRIGETMARSRWSSEGRFNWASFDRRDHLDGAGPLRARLAEDARAQGVPWPDGPVLLLTHLRYLGYCFNPISLYFCLDAAGDVRVVLAEVHNTFGERRNYWLWEGNRTPSRNALRFRCAKAMHVSPFMDMKMDYDFVLTPPEDRLVAHMNTLAGEDRLLDATLTLEREEWTPANLRRALVRWPWMTAKVIAAIHYEALRLFMKRVPVFTHPDRVVQRP